MQFLKIEIHHLMLHDKPNLITDLAPKGPRFVEIIEIMVQPDIPFSCPIQIPFVLVPGINNDQSLISIASLLVPNLEPIRSSRRIKDKKHHYFLRTAKDPCLNSPECSSVFILPVFICVHVFYLESRLFVFYMCSLKLICFPLACCLSLDLLALLERLMAKRFGHNFDVLNEVRSV